MVLFYKKQGDGGAIDQGRQALGEGDKDKLPSVQVELIAAMAQPDRLQLGKPVAEIGVAEEDQ